METHGPLATLWVGLGLCAFYIALVWINTLLGVVLTPLFIVPLTWLQDRVMTLFYRSLCRFGMLGVGRERFPKLITDEKRYEDIGSGWYRKTSKHIMASRPKDNQQEECR